MTIWMTYAIVLGALAVGAALALEAAARAVRIPTRFVWLGAMVVALGAPAVLPVVLDAPPAVPAATAPTAAISTTMGALGPISPASVDPSMSDAVRVLDRPLGWLWLAASLALFIRLAAGVIALSRKRRGWAVREVEGTSLLVTPDMGPAVVAMPDARIILPEWVLSLDAPALATVMRHERQHAAAGDVWLIVAGAVAAAAMPWNPAVWFMRRRLRLAVEVDCDARVLADGGRVDRYGSLLLAIAQHPRVATGLAATLAETSSDL